MHWTRNNPVRKTAALTAALALALLAVTALGAERADAAKAKRVVALEWSHAEDLLTLGITPVGVAELSSGLGYNSWVPAKMPDGVVDVGTRTQPNLEVIAELDPDLILIPSTRDAIFGDQMREIAPTLTLDYYPKTERNKDAYYNQTVRNLKAIARLTGKKKKAKRAIKGVERHFDELAGKLRKKGFKGTPVTIGLPSGSFQQPRIRLTAQNSALATVLEKIGLRNGWKKKRAEFGSNEVGLEALREIKKGWLMMVVHDIFRPAVEDFRETEAYQQLPVVKKDHVYDLPGDTWVYGGIKSFEVFAERVSRALIRSG